MACSVGSKVTTRLPSFVPVISMLTDLACVDLALVVFRSFLGSGGFSSDIRLDLDSDTPPVFLSELVVLRTLADVDSVSSRELVKRLLDDFLHSAMICEG